MTAFNHRLVLDNPHMGWPDDVVAQAEAQRDAELRATAHRAGATTIYPGPMRPAPDDQATPGCHPVVAWACGIGAGLTVAAAFAILWGL